MQKSTFLINLRRKNMWDATNVTSNNLYFRLKFKKILKIRLNERSPQTEKADNKNQ